MRTAPLVLLVALLAGCVVPDAGPTTPTSQEPPVTTTPTTRGQTPSTSTSVAVPDPNEGRPDEIQFVLYEVTYWVNRTSGDDYSTYGDTGGHCPTASYERDPARVRFIHWGQGPDPTLVPAGNLQTDEPAWEGGALLRQYRPGGGTQPVSTIGGGITWRPFNSTSGALEVMAAFDASRVLFHFESDEGEVSVDGEPVAGSWSGRVEYEHTSTSGDDTTTWHVTEIITVTDFGVVPASHENRTNMCI